MLNIIKIFLSKLGVVDYTLVIVVLIAFVILAITNFKLFKQIALNSMKEAQKKFLGETGEERKKKAIEIFRNMKFIKNSTLFKLIPAGTLYNLFEKVYQANKKDIKEQK